MRLLLDTHVLIWVTQDSPRVPRRVADALRSEDNSIFVSAISAWEIANKVRLGKLAFDQNFFDDFDARLRQLSFDSLVLTARHVVAGAALPGRHKDPFDRILAGQALCEGLRVVSIDPAFKELSIQTFW